MDAFEKKASEWLKACNRLRRRKYKGESLVFGTGYQYRKILAQPDGAEEAPLWGFLNIWNGDIYSVRPGSMNANVHGGPCGNINDVFDGMSLITPDGPVTPKKFMALTNPKARIRKQVKRKKPRKQVA